MPRATYIIQKTSTVASVENACETPEMIFKRLNILNINDEHIARLSRLNLKGTRQVMDLRQIHVLNIFGIISILNLASRPVYAFDLDRLAILDRAGKGDYSVSEAPGRRFGYLLSGCHRFCSFSLADCSLVCPSQYLHEAVVESQRACSDPP